MLFSFTVLKKIQYRTIPTYLCEYVDHSLAFWLGISSYSRCQNQGKKKNRTIPIYLRRCLPP